MSVMSIYYRRFVEYFLYNSMGDSAHGFVYVGASASRDDIIEKLVSSGVDCNRYKVVDIFLGDIVKTKLG